MIYSSDTVFLLLEEATIGKLIIIVQQMQLKLLNDRPSLAVVFA